MAWFCGILCELAPKSSPESFPRFRLYVNSIPPKPPDLSTRGSQRIIWKPPPWPKLKVNFDGAVFRDVNSAGVSVMIRDDKGMVVASMAEKFPLPYSVTEVEVIVAIKALRFASENGLASIILERDSKITIDALLGADSSHADFGNLGEEAKMLASQFVDVSYSHAKRQANCAAHDIASYVRHVSKYTVWMKDIPPHLFAVIQTNLAFS